MTNICIFNGDMSRGGGTERITQILANLLSKEKEYQVCVLNLNNESGESYYPLDNNVKLITLKKSGICGKIVALLQFAYKNRIDVLINVDIMLGIFSLPLRIFRPWTKLIAWEMFNIRNDIGSRHTKMIRQLSLLLCNCYVTQTKGDMEAFKSEMKSICQITYVYNPCMDEMRYDGYDKLSKTIVTAGHFYYTKGYDLAVEVARHVFEKHPEWKWEFYGTGTQYENVQKKVAEYGLSKNVIFCGRTSNIEEVYKKAAMYVMTSRTEGFGLVLTEAKCCNLPTLAFDIDFGPREIIESGVSGYLVEAFDVEQMAECICELIENEAKRYSFSCNAKNNLQLFSLENFGQKWKKIISEI